MPQNPVMVESSRRNLLLADGDLMALVGDDDSGAFAVLYDRHGRATFSLVVAIRMPGVIFAFGLPLRGVQASSPCTTTRSE